MRTYVLCFGAALSCIFASAQEKFNRDTVYQSEPVTIIATHASERISPVTFSNLKHSEIKQQYSAQDVPVLLSQLPSITFYSENGNGTGGYSYITLRGFEQQRLSVMVNGVPQNDPEDFNVYWIDFPDLLGSTTNIQVQRGAGSAFYGPPAIGGSVNLLAVPFQPQPSVTLENSLGFQEYGSTNTVTLATRKYSATFNSGLVDNKYMFYGRLSKLSTDGYRDKAWDEINSYFFGAERLDETMTTRIHFYGGPFSDGQVYYGVPKFFNQDLSLRRMNLDDKNKDPHQVNYSYTMQMVVSSDKKDTMYVVPRRPQEAEQFSQPHFEILNEWHLSPTVTFNNTLFYVQGDGYYDYYDGWADTSSLRLGSAYSIATSQNPANVLIRAFVGNKQWGWLPRLEVDHSTGTLTIGAELRIHRSIHWGKITYAENLPANFDPDYHFYEYNGGKDIFSFYVHELYKLSEKTTFMTDLQFAYSRYILRNEKFLNNSFSVPYFFANPRLGINYNANENVNLYASIAYTSREPRLKDLYPADEAYYGPTPKFAKNIVNGTVQYDFSNPIAKPEHLFDFELGSVYQNGHTQASVNFFWMEFQDELVKTGQVDIFGDPVLINASRTRHVGIEVQGQCDIVYGFALSGNTTISYNRLIDCFILDSVSSGTTYGYRLDGNPIAGSPDFLANLRLLYSTGNFNATVDAKYVGGFYTDNTKNELDKNDAYAVCNLSMQYRLVIGSSVNVTLRGEVRNLFNNLYTMSGEGDQYFPSAERNYIMGMSLQF